VLLYRCYMKIIITSFFVFFILSCLVVGPVFAALSPNDPFYKNQWYLSKIEADKAWDKISASPETIIAVIDSGIQIDHPDLKENIWKNKKEIPGDGIDNDNNGFTDDYQGWDFIDNTPNPSPKPIEGWTEAGISHGTIVAGIIAAQGNNNKGIAGVSWQAQIMPLKALNDKGEGKISDVIRAIDYAINNGAHIINLSFTSLSYSQDLQEAIYRAHSAGVMIVAAAGNEQASGQGYNINETKLYPACYDDYLIGENMVIGVAATDALDQKTGFSSYGFNCIDITAPGISFFSTVTNIGLSNTDKYYDGYFSGTSMAAPLVSATLALIQEANPELSRREIVNILFASSDNISSLNPDYIGQLGNGRLNINRAVQMAKEKLYSRLGRLVIVPLGKEEGEVAKEIKISSVNGDLVYNLAAEIIPEGVSFFAGDVNGDGQEELVVGALSGQDPFVRIYDRKGKFLLEFLAADKNFKGGINLTLADLNDDGNWEIITAPASSGSPEIKIFDYHGSLQNSFFIADKSWRGGLQIAAGNIDGRGYQEIVAAFSAGDEPQIRISSAEGNLLGVFLAYEKSFRGGVNLAVANINGRKDRNKAEIIVAPGPGRAPEIKIFTNRANLQHSFKGYSDNWRQGVNISTGDTNKDGIFDIILSAYPGGAPHIRIFNANGRLLESFYAFEEGFLKGVKAGIIKINN